MTRLSPSSQAGKADRDRGRLFDSVRSGLRSTRADDTQLLQDSEAILLDMEHEAGTFLNAVKTLRDTLSQPVQVAA